MNKEVLTVKEAAEFLCVSEQYLRKQLRLGKIPCMAMGEKKTRDYRIMRSAILALFHCKPQEAQA